MLLKKGKIPKNFIKWFPLFKLWHLWLKTNNTPNLNACINYVFNFKEIDKIIIGAKNLKQIKQIFGAIENKSNLYPKNLFTNDYNLINPTKWKIR